jgi:hypothetical protein
MSKWFQMVGFKGSSQEKSPFHIFPFGYRKAGNDKKVPDPVGSGVSRPEQAGIRFRPQTA